MSAFEAMAQSCPPPQVDDTTVTWDFGSCSVGQAQLACTAAGGKYVTVPSFMIVCKANGQTFKINYSNVPDCIGKSCDGSMIENDEAQKEMENASKQALASQGVSGSCNVSNDSPVRAVVLSKIAMVGGLLVLITNLFN